MTDSEREKIKLRATYLNGVALLQRWLGFSEQVPGVF